MTEVVATNETILVVGGGISGVTAALEAAETGKSVILVEKRPYIGGRVVQLYKYFPKLCHPICGMEINQRRVKANRNLSLLTQAEVTEVSGSEGDYTVKLKLQPQFITGEVKGLRETIAKLETEYDDEYNYGMSKRKGVYMPYANAYPERYTLDPRIMGTPDEAILRENTEGIDFDAKEEEVEIKAGAIVWATGWQPFDANKIQPYGYDRFDNVITSVEFERLKDPLGPTGGKLVRPSDGKEAKNVAFIQCSGSRDRNYLKHCSRICCMASLKQSTYVTETWEDDADVSIYYIDIRAIDRFEEFYQNVKKNPNVKFIKSKVAFITEDKDKNPILNGVDVEGYHRYANPHDLVVLAIGMQSSVDKSTFPAEVVFNEEGFIENDESNGGIFAAGCSSDALDVNRAVQSATAAALKAVQIVNKVASAEG